MRLEFDSRNTRLCVDAAAKQWSRRAIVLSVSFATEQGIIRTLEGPIAFQAGDALVVGTRGEQWPIEVEQFLLLYEPSMPEQDPTKNGLFKRRPSLVYAKQISAEFSVRKHEPNDARIFGKANDWLVQQPNFQLGIVANDIFRDLYES